MTFLRKSSIAFKTRLHGVIKSFKSEIYETKNNINSTILAKSTENNLNCNDLCHISLVFIPQT